MYLESLWSSLAITQSGHSLSFTYWIVLLGNAYMSLNFTSCRPDSRPAPSQWETSLQSNTVSHWLGANLESALSCIDNDFVQMVDIHFQGTQAPASIQSLYHFCWWFCHARSQGIRRHIIYLLCVDQSLSCLVFNQVPLWYGSIKSYIPCSTVVTDTEHIYKIKLTTDTLTGRLWGVYCEDFGESLPHFNDTVL